MVINIIVITATVATTARLTRLVTADLITQPFRAALLRRSTRARQAGRHHALVHWIAALVHCNWCSGLWCSAITTAYAHHLTHWNWAWYPLALGATAWLSAIAADHLDHHDQGEQHDGHTHHH